MVWHVGRRNAPGGRRRRRGRGRLGAPPRVDAHAHRAPRAVRGHLERMESAGDRREHGAAVGPHGLRVRPAARGLRPARRGARQRRARGGPSASRCRSCPATSPCSTRTSSAPRSASCPTTVHEIRVVDIVGLDKQADGGTHVRTTGEVGRIRVVEDRIEGKGQQAHPPRGRRCRSRRCLTSSLEAELRALGDVVVAFSGGADSAFLASVATRTLGAERVHCVTAVSSSLAASEREDCAALAARVGPAVDRGRDRRAVARRRTSPTTAMRCFWCKTVADGRAGADRRASSARPSCSA